MAAASAASVTFDRRIVPEVLLGLVKACQALAPAHLGGGAALAGVHLGHRRTRDLDLFVHDARIHRELVAALPEVARRAGLAVAIVRDGGGFVRARIDLPQVVELDLVHETLPDLGAPVVVEGIVTESLDDLRASKLTCLLSRSEPRDLVDVLFLERAGHRVEDDLALALRKDAGIDPAILAWLLERFPVEPLPDMLVDLDVRELLEYRDALRERLRRLALP
jgi:hypothetical protein